MRPAALALTTCLAVTLAATGAGATTTDPLLGRIGIHAAPTPTPVRVAGGVDEPLWVEQVELRETGVDDAWEFAGTATTRVAVVDTGVDARHPDLAGKLSSGWDVYDDDDDPHDEHFHGTFIAGQIAAGSGNGVGIAGICPTCTVLPVRALGPDGSGNDVDVARAIVWAVDNGADVINLSLTAQSRSEVLDAALDYAAGADVVLVASAGNDGGDVPNWPAAHPDVIAVAGTTFGAPGLRDERSTYGPWVDVAAPGQATSLQPVADGVDPYRTAWGTSMAAANVSGGAGLVRSTFPQLSALQVRQALASAAATDVREFVGGGFVNHVRWLQQAALLAHPQGEPATLVGRACADAGTAAFADVGMGPHRPTIGCLQHHGVVAGCGPTTFCPAEAVTRAQFASLLDRTADLLGLVRPTSSHPYGDVGPAHADAVGRLAADGVVDGCDVDRFCPHVPITRAQAATMAHNLLVVAGVGSVHPLATTPFDDAVDHRAAAALQRLGVLAGCADGLLCPEQTVTRAQAATLAARLLGVGVGGPDGRSPGGA